MPADHRPYCRRGAPHAGSPNKKQPEAADDLALHVEEAIQLQVQTLSPREVQGHHVIKHCLHMQHCLIQGKFGLLWLPAAGVHCLGLKAMAISQQRHVRTNVDKCRSARSVWATMQPHTRSGQSSCSATSGALCRSCDAYVSSCRPEPGPGHGQ